jgi:hypothetical protein
VAQFTILSETHTTTSPIDSLYSFLTDFKNFGSILPEDKVEQFTWTETSCSFNIKGITPMTIRLAEKEPGRFILFTSEGLAKFNFSLRVRFEGESALPGECRIELDGDLNPFIKAMAEKPLTGLVNTMSLKLASLEV